MKVEIEIPDKLHPDTALLVARFATALAEKLRAAEVKHGYSNFWTGDHWRVELTWSLIEHIQKGDPRDVAALCAFAWHHGWSVTPEPLEKSEPLKKFEMLGIVSTTPDGFPKLLFKDSYGSSGAIEQSTLALNSVPGTSELHFNMQCSLDYGQVCLLADHLMSWLGRGVIDLNALARPAEWLSSPSPRKKPRNEI